MTLEPFEANVPQSPIFECSAAQADCLTDPAFGIKHCVPVLTHLRPSKSLVRKFKLAAEEISMELLQKN